MAEVIGGQRQVDIDGLLRETEQVGLALDALHEAHLDADREALRRLFILRVALSVAGQLLQRYRSVLAGPAPLPEKEAPMPIDFEFGGVYLPPIAQALLLGLVLFLVADAVLRRVGVLARVWHPALFQGALYAAICAALVLTMGASV